MSVNYLCHLFGCVLHRSELDAWYNAFNSILIQLGWKESESEDGRPNSYPQKSETSSTDQVNGDRYSAPGPLEGGFQEEVIL